MRLARILKLQIHGFSGKLVSLADMWRRQTGDLRRLDLGHSARWDCATIVQKEGPLIVAIACPCS